ncbi:MFS general substrate transporter [Stereum hirsutum FP-91666 SS1]|uniref:MFS general substrate transporter n=1 Tax=Stereum hirsutum (strain FP-91666) TaxID=721885 RepID=UPI000440BC6E|nr:MFS general substrate transporter [Stereum hirsutum FP-91666 SS1]EIM90358.1 MFS general substrate transporter [Stereum hirsutum FP-91666 SS1]
MEAKHSSTELSQKSTKNNSGSKHLVVDSYTVDEAAALTAGQDFHVTPEDAARVRRKIDLHLMPLMCREMTFMDKTTLGQSATLGILTSAKLTTDEFNWLGTIFYIAYLFFQWPQNLALQRFPVGKWMSVNVFVWAVALLCHAACKSFGSLFAVRLIMGIAEGAITPGFMLLTSMFYTRVEQTRRVGYWFLMNGVAIIILGFVAFGVLHTTNENFQPWQWLMVITGLITLIISVIFWFFFPDSPMTAHFLSEDERLIAVERIKVNQAGVENKHFKRDQYGFVETMCDPKTYLLFFFAASSNVVNSLTNQRQIIVKLFGFSTIDTTLLGCVDGVVEILVIWLGVFLAAHFKNARVYSAISLYVPAILGSILVTTLPADNKVGRLFSYWISIFAFPPFVIVLGWVGQITAGHTKKTTTNAVVLIGYSVGNAAGPAMWKSQYQPLNHVPWAIISGCSFLSAIILLITRIYLARENNLRDSENQDSVYDDAVIVVEDGSNEKEKEKKVDKAFLDLTDRQNRDFRYVL